MGEKSLSVDQNGGISGSTVLNQVIGIGRSKFKFCWGRVGINQSEQPEDQCAAQGKKSIAGEFEKITAGNIRHGLPFHCMALVTITRFLSIRFLLTGSSHHRTEGELFTGSLTDHLVGSVWQEARIPKRLTFFGDNDGVIKF
jgi:hypothetical protein